MRNIIEYPITQEEKRRFVEQMNEGVGSIEPLLLQTFATEFAIWVWTRAIEYIRGGHYTVQIESGLDISRTYTIEELYDHWLRTEWYMES